MQFFFTFYSNGPYKFISLHTSLYHHRGKKSPQTSNDIEIECLFAIDK